MQPPKRNTRIRKRPINQKDAREGFISLHPDFEACWQEAKELYEDTAVVNIYTVIAENLPKIIKTNPNTDFGPVVDYVEKLMREGTAAVHDIIALYFIGSLLASSEVYPDVVAPLLKKLGPLSRSYALKWNEAIGETNLGLER